MDIEKDVEKDVEKVRLTKERETYLMTLYGKALDSRVENSILGDRFADEVVRQIDFDFTRLKLPKGASISLPVRAKHLDEWTRAFLAAHPSATVLHLGCGLDSRICRIDPPPTVRWYDVDRPEVIALRRRLYPERHDYSMIGASLTDLGWLDEIPADRPVLVVAEGLVVYLPEKGGVALFNRITQQFPSGQFIFDAYGRVMVRVLTLASSFLGADISLSWAMDDPHQLEKQVPRLKLVTAIPFLSMPELVSRLSQSAAQRFISRHLERFGWVKRLVAHLRYEF